MAVEEAAIRNGKVGAQQAWKRLAEARVERVDEVRLALFREVSVCAVTSQIGQTCPFKDQRADSCNAVAGGVGETGGIEKDTVVRDAGGCVEGELEGIA